MLILLNYCFARPFTFQCSTNESRALAAVCSGESGFTGGYCVRHWLFVFCLFSVSAFCQINDAVLGGNVIDPQGRAFPGAEVELISSSTRAVRRVSSNERGIFEIAGLPPGDYELKVQAPGFSVLAQSL